MNILKPTVGIPLAFLLLVLPMSVGADVVFDNLPAGPPPSISSGDLFVAAQYQPATSFGERCAVKFTATRASYTLDSVTLAISQWGGGDYLRVRLAVDAGGAPGATIEVLSEAQNIWPQLPPFSVPVQVASTLHPTLVSGQSYWIVAELTTTPGQNTAFAWCMNDCGEVVYVLKDYEYGGLPQDPWFELNLFQAAFRVDGTPISPVQEEIPNWPHDSLVGLSVVLETGTQSQQVAVTDGAGGAIVAWEDTRNGNGDIYAQRVSPLGKTLWKCNGVRFSPVGGTQTTPAMMSDGSGGAFLVWPDLRNGFNYKLYAQRIDGNGVAQWAPDGIPICSGSGDQVHAALVSDGQGGVIVAWSDTRILPVDVYAQRISPSGALLWGGAGVPIATGSGAQWVPQIVTDGSGGAIIAWWDFRNAIDYDIYAQRVNASGGTLWTLNGVPVANAINDQTEVKLVANGLGGAIAIWLDARNGINTTDIYAQLLGMNGSWRWNNALAITTQPGNQANLKAMSDGVGGAFLAWQEPGSGLDVYVEHLRSGGTTAYAIGMWVAAGAGDELNPSLTSDGAGGALVSWQEMVGGSYNIGMARFDKLENVSWNFFFQPVSNASGHQQIPQMVSDDDGGAIVIWQDTRNANTDLYCQRVERFLYLGNPEPTPLGVTDVAGDQGGMVQVSWAASYLEAQFPGLVNSYRVWRSVPPQAPGLQSMGRVMVTGDPEVAIRTGEPLITHSAGGTQSWEFVGTVTANNSATYQFQAPTAESAVPGSSPVTAFMIQARSNGVTPYFFSVPWLGTALDNLAPGTPTGLYAIYGLGAVELRWNENPEPDIDEYRIYRGTTQDFAVGPGSFWTSVPDTDYVGPTDRSYVYKVTALDIHGNESLWATVTPWQTGIETPLPVRFVMSSPTPNPARDIATIRWSLPESGVVRLHLYDLEGRRVKILEDGLTQAGEHVRPIPLRDDAGRTLANGLYFLRLDWNGETRVQRLAVVR